MSLVRLSRIILPILLSWNASAYETDQYTVPPQPLADIGEDLSLFIHSQLQDGIEEINRLRAELPNKIKTLTAEASRAEDFISAQQLLVVAEEQQRQLSSQTGMLEYLFKKYSLTITWNDQRDGVFGVGLSYALYPNDMKTGRPTFYNHGKFNTIYSYAGFHRIMSPSYFVFASTVNLYGTYMGVDKIGHLINQGYEYSRNYQRHLEEGFSPAEALRRVVNWGIETEDGLFGTIVDGVYSNADLAANFAGFMFYQNFFHDLRLRGKLHPRIVEIDADGNLTLSRDPENGPRVLMKRFISEHLDESLNPNLIERLQRGPVRRAIMDRCASWLAFYKNPSKEQLAATIERTRLWFGYDYGRRIDGAILPEECL